MIRQTITLNDYTYVVDLYKAISDLKGNEHYEEFVMLRKTSIMNSIMYDNDVYFISKSIVDSCIVDNELDTDMLSKIIAYPITNNQITMSYLNDYKRFNENFTKYNFKVGQEISELYDKNCKGTAKILCDKLRIWLPITNSKLNALLHVNNTINDITFHYICQRTDSFDINSNGEMKFGNNIYSEYYDVWIPNVEYLFSESSIYMKEDYNISEIRQKIMFNYGKDNYITIVPRVYFDLEDDAIVKKMKIEVTRSTIDDRFDVFVSKNGNEYKLEWSMMTSSLDEIDCEDVERNALQKISNDDIIDILVKDENGKVVSRYGLHHKEIINDGNELFVSLFMMILPFYIEDYSSEPILIDNPIDALKKCKLYYDIDLAIVDNTLVTPLIASLYKYDYIDEVSALYLQQYKVTKNSDVFTMSRDMKLKTTFEFCNNPEKKSYGAMMLNCKFSYSGQDTDDEDAINNFYLNKMKLTLFDYINFVDIEENYDKEIFSESIKKCGFLIEMASDSNFKDVIYKYVANVNIEDESDKVINNCEIGLNFYSGMVEWDKYPETLVVKARFIDKVASTIIESNPIFVTKEIFKYLINGDSMNIDYRLKMYDNNQIYDEESMDLEKFNFIDKINCVVVNNTEDTENSISNAKTTTKIVYKPIFYKVKDLQQIKIKNGIAQNIGLNLSDFISKVDTFKIIIEGKEYVEIARNDGYVIFNVNALEIKEMNGQYILVNQDDEYISDGTWYVY